ALLTYVNLIAALLASRMAFDAYGSTDLFATFTFAGAVAVAYLLGGFTNFFLRRPFVSDAVLSLMLMVTMAFIVISFFSKDLKQIAAKYERATTNAVAEPSRSERDGTPKVIAAEDKARLSQAGMGGSWWASILYTVTPNWQLFWFGDTLESEQAGFNWNYVGK